jgi:hypothetical protein
MLHLLLIVHGFVTLAAGIVLIVTPQVVPSVVGVQLQPSAYLIAYLLAGGEIGFAVLSFGASRIRDAQALRVIVWSCVVFHGASAALEIYAYIHGVNAAILGNVAARLVVIGLFAYALTGLRPGMNRTAVS